VKSWPWPDSPIKKRERIALTYRHHLETIAPALCSAIDTEMLEYEGNTWLVPRLVTYLDDELLTADQVAEYCDVSLQTVYMWRAQRGLPSIKTRDGIRFVFAEVRKWKSSR
jgi:excisionase family DNA binding protein